MNTSILPNKNDENIFSEKLFNGVHDWIGNNPHVNKIIKINGALVKKNTSYFKYVIINTKYFNS